MVELVLLLDLRPAEGEGEWGGGEGPEILPHGLPTGSQVDSVCFLFIFVADI